MPTSPLLRRLAALLAFVMIAGLITFSAIPANATRLHTWPLVFYTHIILLAPILAVALCLLLSRPAVEIHSSGLLACAIAVGTSVMMARIPVFSGEASLLLFAGLAWIWCVATWTVRPTFNAHIFARCVGVAFSIPLVSAVILWLHEFAFGESGPFLLRLLATRNPHPFGHWNYTAGFALLALPWLVTLCRRDRRGWRWVWFPLTAIGISALFSTSSRGGALGLAALCVAVGLAQLVKPRRNWFRIVAVLAAILATLTTVIVSNQRLRNGILRPASTLSPNEGDVQRIAMLQGGLLLASERPFIGHGPGMTALDYPAVRSRLVGGVETSFQLHNSLLQIVVDHGAGGFAALMLLGFQLIRGARAEFRRQSPPVWGTHDLVLASSYALFGYAAFALTDYQLNVPAIVAAAGLHSGIILAVNQSQSRRSHGPNKCAAAALVTLCIVLLGTVLMPEWRARSIYWSAWHETPEADRTLLLKRLSEAADASPHNPFYRTMYGLQLGTEAGTIRTLDGSARLVGLGIAQLERSLRLDPLQEPAHAGLAWLRLKSNDPSGAAKEFENSISLLPGRDTLHFGLSLCRLAADDKDAAVHELALECLVNPLFLRSPLWQQSILSPYRSRTLSALESLLSTVRVDHQTPSFRVARIDYIAAWVRWTEGGVLPSSKELNGAESWQAAYINFLRLPHSTTRAIFPVEALYNAWQKPAAAQAILRAFTPQIPDIAIQGAIARLSIYPATFDQLLLAQAPNRRGWAEQSINRVHYNIMYRNLDGPGMPDLAPRQIDAFVTEFLSTGAPLKDLIPGPVLSKLAHRR